MKLLEFLGIIRENASNGTGTFVGARLTRDSERAIMRWMRDNGLRKKEPRARFHITVVGDKERSFEWNPATFDPPLEIDPSSYKIEKFDGGSIVLSFSIPELEKRHEQAIKDNGINWDFPTYQPHLTLSYDPTELNNVDRLLKPTFPMYVANEYAQPWGFKESDERTNRRRSTRVDEALLFERNVMNAPDTNMWAKHMADGMFGEYLDIPHTGDEHGTERTVRPAHEWAQKALRKYMINDVPAPQIVAFKPTPNDPRNVPGASPDMSGTASVAYPRTEGTPMFGLLSGHTRDKPMTVPNWVPGALQKGEEVFWLDDRFIGLMNGALASVRDWFRYLIRNEPQRLNPARLNRMTWEQAEQAAFAWHDAMKASDVDDAEELEGDKEVYLELGNATWWKLTGQSCLDREGNMMGHCVADYLDDVQDGNAIIFSLRDAKNQPHVTVELSEDNTWASRDKASVKSTSIAQVKGKENKPPVEKYWGMIDALIKKLNNDVTSLGVSGDGQNDLAECEILQLGSMLIRTDPPLEDVNCIINVVQSPMDRKWSMYDNEEMPLWEALKDLADRDMLPDPSDGYGSEFDDSQKISQYIKWVLLRDKEFDVEIRGHMDEAFFDDNQDFNRSNLDREDEVHTHINIKVPDIKYEVLSGTPDEFKFDIKHALAMRGSLT